MKIREVQLREDDESTPKPDQLMGLVSFLAGRAEDTGGKKQISKQAFVNLANTLGITISPQNLDELSNQPPLSNLLEPVDPNSDVVVFKGGEPADVNMPVDRAQDVVAKAAKSAAKRNRGV